MANSNSQLPVPQKIDPSTLGPCDSRIIALDGTLRCFEAAKITRLPVEKCNVGADACKVCLTMAKRPNSVIASMAIGSANIHLPQDDARRVLEAVRPLVTSHAPPAKRVTAADLPCVHRGELLRVIQCEICGDRGSPVEVYSCFSGSTKSDECTAGRWTTDPIKSLTGVCLTCQHRTEPVAISLEGVNQPQPPPPAIQSSPPSTLTDSDKKPCKLTIGMACYDDEPGVFFTVQALRMYHADVLKETNAEILVIDSNPGSKHGKAVRELCENWSGGILRYIPAEFAKGTSAPRDLVFREARGEVVICIDCHVLLAPGALRALVDHFTENPDSIDLIQGPMLHHGNEIYATHMRREWGSDLMLGKWETDPQIWDLDNSPFEIEGHGMGLFACRKLAWRGFNPAFQGFGGEELQYHDKVRAAGGKCLCLPQLQWLHKFSRVDGVPYPLRLEDRFRNYLIGHIELGRDITEVLQRFAGRIPQESYGRIVAEVMKVFENEVKAEGVAA